MAREGAWGRRGRATSRPEERDGEDSTGMRPSKKVGPGVAVASRPGCSGMVEEMGRTVWVVGEAQGEGGGEREVVSVTGLTALSLPRRSGRELVTELAWE